MCSRCRTLRRRSHICNPVAISAKSLSSCRWASGCQCLSYRYTMAGSPELHRRDHGVELPLRLTPCPVILTLEVSLGWAATEHSVNYVDGYVDQHPSVPSGGRVGHLRGCRRANGPLDGHGKQARDARGKAARGPAAEPQQPHLESH